MEKNDKSKEAQLCSNVFKSGANTTTKKEYTNKWIELINKIERDKSVTFCEKQ